MTAPIAGIGELLWDVYPDGRKVAGGAPFNFAYHCAQLGHPATIISRVGDDDLGRELRHEVLRLGLSDEFIQTDRIHPTGTVTVSLDEQKVPTYTITRDVAWDFIEPVSQLNLAAICFGTLALRSPVSRSSILDVVRETTGLRVLDVNIRPPFLPAIETLRDCFRAAEWVKLGTDDLAKAGDLLRESERDHCPAVRILTKGDAGCEITGDEVFRLPADPSKVVDTVGAGDAFTAAMVCLHLEGRPLAECARFATHYAARVCEHQGATPRIDRAPVERAAFGAP